MVSDPILVFFVIALVVSISIWLEQHSKLFKPLGAAATGILLGMVLSNIGFLPGQSSTYDILVGPGVNIGVIFILLSVDMHSIRKAGPVMLKAFGIGVAGTIIGSVLMAFLLSSVIGAETWKLSGQFTGTYIGGGMNFAALGKALGTSSDLFTAAVAADVIITAIWLVACLTVPVILGRKVPTNNDYLQPVTNENREDVFTLERSLYSSGYPIHLIQIAALICIAIGSLWFAGVLSSWFSFFPKVLWLTTIALVIAQFPVIKKLSGSAMIGNYLLLLFLASNGAQSVIANIIRMGPAVFYFAAGTVFVHGLVIFGIGRLFGIDLGTLAVASQANVGGSASAMAMASARGYADRILPGVAVGLLGYATGNYIGLGIANIMRNIL